MSPMQLAALLNDAAVSTGPGSRRRPQSVKTDYMFDSSTYPIWPTSPVTKLGRVSLVWLGGVEVEGK